VHLLALVLLLLHPPNTEHLEMADQITKWPNYSPHHESKSEMLTKFPDLPPEIRREIWRCLLPGPRVIHIMGSARAGGGKCFVDTVDNPTLLHICQESRIFALEKYQLSFEPHLRRPIYFDFSLDILLMQNEKVLSMFFERSKGAITKEVTMVKVLAIDLPPLSQVASTHVVNHLLFIMSISSAMIDAAARFGNLREIVLLSTQSQNMPDLENSVCSESFQAKMRSFYSSIPDPYALKRRELLKDEDGSIPKTKTMTVVDFWKGFP
jgi:hypothetical protein